MKSRKVLSLSLSLLILLFAACGEGIDNDIQSSLPDHIAQSENGLSPQSDPETESQAELSEISDIENLEETPKTYENPIQEAICSYRWVESKDMQASDDYPAAYYLVQLLDIDLDGQLEVLIFGTTNQFGGNNACLVLKIKDHELVPVGSFDVSKREAFYQDGKKEYHQKENGEYVMYQWIEYVPYGHIDSYSLVEITLQDIISTPIVTYSIPRDAVKNTSYYYFDSQNFTYHTGGVNLAYAPADLPSLGYIEITESEYEARRDRYLASVTYCGDLVPIDVVEYPFSLGAATQGKEFYGIDNIQQYCPTEPISAIEYDPYDDKLNEVVAEIIYEAYMANA